MLALLLAGGGTWLGLRARPRAAAPLVIDKVDPTEARLRSAVAAAPADPAPCRELAEYLAGRKRYVSALWEYQAALDRRSGDHAARIGLAKVAANVQEFGVAEAQLEPVLRPRSGASASERREAARALAIVRVRINRAGEAAALLESLKAEFPDLALERARAYHAAGREGPARAEYLLAMAEPSTRRDAALGLAQLHLEQGAAPKAVEVLSQAGRDGPMDAELWLWLGRACAATPGGLDRAAACVLNGMKLAPRNAELYYEAGLLFRKKGQPTDAADQLSQALRLDPGHTAARRALAETLDALGLSRRAREQWARYYEAVDQPDRVITALSDGGEDVAASSEVAVRLIYAWTRLQDAGRAAAVSEKARARYPDSRDLLTQAISIQLVGGSPAKLESLATEWDQKYPHLGEGPWFRGRAALSDARYADAVKQFEAAVAREPKRIGFRLALADAYARVPTPENLRKALTLVEQAAAANPANVAARRQLGELLLRLGRPKDAEPHLLRALDLDPGQRRVRNSLMQAGVALGRTGQVALLGQMTRDLEARDRELARLRRDVQARPGDPAAHEAYGLALARAGRLQKARYELARAAEAPDRQSARAALTALERALLVLGV